MKKTLRTLALAALALPLVASAELTLNEVWVNGVVDGVCNPLPGLDGGWTKPVPGNPGTSTCSRFAVGKDGKILTTKHNQNAIIAWDGKNMTTFAQLPAVTAEKWNGTAITTDDAGNVIFNFCFTDATKSITEWGVVAADGSITEVTMPMADFSNLGAGGRLDIISHIVGDVNSEKGGIGYAVAQSTDKVIMFHFKGDGKKVTSLTAKASVSIPEIAQNTGNGLNVPSAKYVTIDEILASKTPENEFYLPIGQFHPDNQFSVIHGFLATVENGYFSPILGISNRSYLASAVFKLGDKKYIAREYVDESAWPGRDSWRHVMTVGIFDLETSKCVASWMGSKYTNYYGMATLSAEVVDEHTVNIYTWAATGSNEDADKGPTKAGCYAAMLKLTDGTVAAEPDGTKEHPYEIATADDLCNMWSLMKPGAQTYFIQTADIDMAGVEEYIAPNGHSGGYNCAIHYDGQNHVIKNFAPKFRAVNADNSNKGYYCTTIFGVIAGTVKNLGVVDANVEAVWYEGGILAGFFGGTWVEGITHSIDNVFVTGKTVAKDIANVNGVFGQNAAPGSITNFYAQVEVVGGKEAGIIMGNAGTNTITVSNSYVSGKVAGTTNNLIANGSVSATNVVAFGEGSAPEGVTVVPANDAAAIATIQTWAAFNEGKLFNGLPALNWQDEASGIFDIAVDEAEDAPAVYYNLQGVEVANPDNGIYIVRRGNKVTKELIRR